MIVFGVLRVAMFARLAALVVSASAVRSSGKAPTTSIKLVRWISSDYGTTVTAVASANNLLFVVRDEIEVYSATTFELLRSFTLPEASLIYGLAASPTNNFLYVSNSVYSVIHRFNLTTDPSSIDAAGTTWPVCSNPRGLSVNRAQNILVACSNGIREYAADGSLVRQLPYNFGSSVWHAVEVSPETWAVSLLAPQNEVCFVTTSGTLLSCCGTVDTKSGPSHMNVPFTMAADQEGNVIVADSNNNRILVLNPTVTKARLLPLPPQGIVEPMGLWLDKSRGRLYIGENGGYGRVLVFDNVVNLNKTVMP